MSKIIGIDLGTTNSAVAVVEGGTPTIITNSEGKRTTPSVVAFTKDGERKIGEPAKRQAITNPENTVYSIKRFMGEEHKQVSNEISNVPYKVVNSKGMPKVSINDKKYSPQEISAMILQKMKQTAEEYLGEEVTEAVITVPAYFGDAQRQATKEAGEIAGLNVKRIINEPTAAALAFGIDKADKDMNVAVYDAGGGTFDISILQFGGGVFEVLSTNGDTHLGGDDFDQAIINWIADEFKNDTGVDVRGDAMAMQRLKEAAEKAKIELSSNSSSDINLPFLTANENGPQHFAKSLTRANFDKMTAHLVNRTIEPCKKALNDAGLTPAEIDEVILVGGTTRIPAIQEAVKNLFGKEPSHNVNPDEAVAIGAAIQGGVLAGDVKDVVLLDVTPLNLGIETFGGVMTNMIDANTTIPTKRSEIFSTAVDNQPGVEVRVLQGNRAKASDNKQLGIFHLDGIAPAPAHVPQIEVTFDIDANGILNVTAVDKATNKEQHITIDGSSKLPEEEIERMRKEAEENAEADKKFREDLATINGAETMVNSVENSIKEFGEKVTEDEKNDVNAVIENLKNAIYEKNIEDIEKYQKELQEKWFPIASKVYEATKPQGDENTENGVEEEEVVEDVETNE